jgi:hypothetical protein
MTDDQVAAQHELASNLDSAWILSADSLLAGARALVELRYACEKDYRDLPIGSPVPRDEKVLKPAFLLYGFALETDC